MRIAVKCINTRWQNFLVLAALGGTTVGLAHGAGAAADDYPKDLHSAIQRFEVEVEPKKWLQGPVEYILLNDERKIWKDLKTDADRRAFMNWFWGRRDTDMRDDVNPFRNEFYKRVADVNTRFTGFPRGWKSDRGRIWISFGRPDGLRRRSMRNYGRCSGGDGELWSYFTQNRPYRANFGEFIVLFVETRPSRFELCDSMLGPGAFPPYLHSALDMVKESVITDPSTEFDAASASLRVRRPTGTVESEFPIVVPLEGWATTGAAGAVVLPIEIRVQELVFRPQGDSFAVQLNVEALLQPRDRNGAQIRAAQQWMIALSEAELMASGGASLRSAVAVEAPPGKYSATVKIADPSTASVGMWEGDVEVAGDGAAVATPLVAASTIALEADGIPRAVVSAEAPSLNIGVGFVVVAWASGATPASERVAVTLVDGDGNEHSLPVETVRWGGPPAGPLVVESVLDGIGPGRYTLRLDAGTALGSTTTQVIVR